MKKDLLVFAACAALLTLFVVFVPDTLLADGNPFDKITTKTESIYGTVMSVAKVLCAIGIVVGGVKKVMGHPDAWTWLWSSVLGTIIVFSADAIVQWLQ